MIPLAVVWHWWLGVFLAIGGIGLVISIVAGYLARVENPRYKKD